MLGGLLDKEVKIADRIARKNTKPLLTKGGHRDVFTGNLIVLVDSESASASELLARTVQLQKRGTVMGDLTSGATMEAEIYPLTPAATRNIIMGLKLRWPI
jgi:C-terminal processing protease CtpA/Prc